MDKTEYFPEHEFHTYSNNYGLISMLVQISKEITFDYEQVLKVRNYIDNKYLNESNLNWCLGRAPDKCDTAINVEVNRNGKITGNIRFKDKTRDDIYFTIS